MTILELAESIARRAHAGQREESTGDDYIKHIERVVGLVEGDDAKAVAWLHDVIEDTPMGAIALRFAGIPGPIVEAVIILTRADDETYEVYIQRIQESGDELAIAVKIADLRDHMRPGCPDRLRARYVAACLALGIYDKIDTAFWR